MTVDRLRPGEQVDPQRFNQLVDALNSKAMSSPSIAVQDGAGGTGLVPSRTLQPVWGRLTDEGPDSAPDHYYQWEEVYQDNDGKWQSVREDSDGGYGSQLVPGEAYPYDDLLLNPAVEVNGNEAPIKQVVRLTPTRLIVDANENVHRAWQFTSAILRPFILTQPLIPTGEVVNEDTAMSWEDVEPGPPIVTQGQRDTTVSGEWLDAYLGPGQVREPVTLYGQHLQGWPQGDQFISLGIGTTIDSNMLGFGTKGWAKYVPQATIIDIDDNGENVWRGEWQIVELAATTVILARVSPATILPGQLGEVIPWQMITGNLPLKPFEIGSLVVYNNLPVPLTLHALHNFHFIPELYAWFPVTPLATQHALSLYASVPVYATVNGEWVTVLLDNQMGMYGEELASQPFGIINRGSMVQIGHASYDVTAERDFGVAGPADVDSVLETALFNGGDPVPGTFRRISSSRRIPPELGTSAVNSAGCSDIVQTLNPGDMLEVKVRKMLALEVDDNWVTLTGGCSLTYRTVTSTFLQERGVEP